MLYLLYDAVLWELDKLFDQYRGEHLFNGFFRRQLARWGAQIQRMVLPDHGAELKGDELQQPLGDRGAQDKDFIGLPTRHHRGMVLRSGGF